MGGGNGAGGAAFSLAALRVDALKVGDQLACQLKFRLRHRGIGDDAVEDIGRLAGPQVLPDSAGNQLAEHGVQPAHDLGAQPG